ncbi:MAG: type II toxin-antitoxin system RelE/ParE family toxin [Cellvibrionaceae bacterium]|nr:type II toxin-antitoxin system RelE/ParE family toxin [Cellvibrionaceae bacterium]MCV6624964.1 type II toxin-antitoxin system RelE/ParE family toxin [Cellvibrionaceae bacterium]
MPRLIITERAAEGLAKCQRYLRSKNPSAMARAANIISEHFSLLATNPSIGNPHSTRPEFKELIIPFGKAGYIALYQIEGDLVYILAFRHQREAGY